MVDGGTVDFFYTMSTKASAAFSFSSVCGVTSESAAEKVVKSLTALKKVVYPIAGQHLYIGARCQMKDVRSYSLLVYRSLVGNVLYLWFWRIYSVAVLVWSIPCVIAVEEEYRDRRILQVLRYAS